MNNRNFLTGKYVLYAEDDQDDRLILENMMRTMPGAIDMVTVENGQQVLNFLQELPSSATLPCFILLDINMPLMDGYTTLQRLQAHPIYRSITVIMYSTADYAVEHERARKAGAKQYISKPFSMSVIQKVCESFARLCHSEPQLIK